MHALDEVAAKESAILAAVRDTGGPYKKRYALLGKRGVYADYAEVFAAYVRLLDDPAVATEALKRAVFLNWYPTCEPAWFPPDHVLDDTMRRQALAALDRAVSEGALDDECRWMLPYYVAVNEDAFLDLDDFPATLAFLEGDDTESVPLGLTPEQFAGRGQMGAYWRAVVESRSYRERTAP